MVKKIKKPKPKPPSPEDIKRRKEVDDSINRVYKKVAEAKRIGILQNKIAKKFKDGKMKKPPKPFKKNTKKMGK
tara:strand:+ start:442 stop:663 length:222 start_codon:yes stop_codon:yes gene_type:complete